MISKVYAMQAYQGSWIDEVDEKAILSLGAAASEHRTVTPGGEKVFVKLKHFFTSWTSARCTPT